jgi:hypothetical protein
MTIKADLPREFYDRVLLAVGTATEEASVAADAPIDVGFRAVAEVCVGMRLPESRIRG